MSKKIIVPDEIIKEIIEYYINQNNSKVDTCSKFNLSSTKLLNLLRENGIKKTTRVGVIYKEPLVHENTFTCKVCGKSGVKNLEAHIRLLHKMTKQEYIDKYNYKGNFMVSMLDSSKEKMRTKKIGKIPWNKGLTIKDERISKIVKTRRNNDNYIMTSKQKTKISNTLSNRAYNHNNWVNTDTINNVDKLKQWSTDFLLDKDRKPTYDDLATYIKCSYHTAERIIKKNKVQKYFKINNFSKLETTVEDFIKSIGGNI